MCLGIPGRIVEIIDEDLTLAKAEVSGVRRNINIGLVQAQSQLQALEDIGEAYEQELTELRASQIE